tara:strand:- start:62 stop:394 length:333 start_codon:yes stop_codon:yes gene_type:complete
MAKDAQLQELVTASYNGNFYLTLFKGGEGLERFAGEMNGFARRLEGYRAETAIIDKFVGLAERTVAIAQSFYPTRDMCTDVLEVLDTHPDVEEAVAAQLREKMQTHYPTN